MKMAKTHHVAGYKKEIVRNIIKYIKEYPIVGIVNMENLPAPQLQAMKSKLRGKVHLCMTKKRLMKIALEQLKSEKRGIDELEKYFEGMPALLFTKESPFKLSKSLQQSKSSAPAKPGQTAPKDIIIPKGPTSFTPGPIISELSSIGIKTGVEGGKVAVKEDSIVAKKGEKIKPKVAEVLTRMGIEPMEVGLDLMAAYENGIIYPKDILLIDEKEFMSNLNKACSWAFNLAVFINYPTKDTINILLGKAFNDAKALGISQNIIDSVVIEDLLGKAEMGMLSLKSTANIEVQEKAGTKAEEMEGPEEGEKKEGTKPEAEEEGKTKEEKADEPKKEEAKGAEKVSKEAVKEEKAETKEEKGEEKKAEALEKQEEQILEKEKEIIKEEQEIEKKSEEKEKAETELEKEAEG
jgi:large subunit ribosomal protein L10